MSNKENSFESKFYIPICREAGCDGNLKISFNEYDFTVHFECGKNKNHKGKKYFKIFEDFYLKEKEIIKCYKCSNNLLNNSQYICNKCEKIYCSKCFISDDHIKDNKKNLFINSKLCKAHQHQFIGNCSFADTY